MNDAKRAARIRKIQTLAERGATEGERNAAREALKRMGVAYAEPEQEIPFKSLRECKHPGKHQAYSHIDFFNVFDDYIERVIISYYRCRRCGYAWEDRTASKQFQEPIRQKSRKSAEDDQPTGKGPGLWGGLWS